MDGHFAATIADTPLENLCETLNNGKGSWHILTNTNSLRGLSHSASKPASSGTVKICRVQGQEFIVCGGVSRGLKT
ncbi:MAG: hypothetical protein V7K62_08765 [Nostoc sp.]